MGAGLAVAVAAPQLLSGWGARVMEQILQERIKGKVRVEGVELSWNGPQYARSVMLSSPEDSTIAVGSLKIPSILQFLDEESSQHEFYLRIDKLDAHINGEGVSDLAVALGLDPTDGRSSLQTLIDAFVREARASAALQGAELAPSRQVTLRVHEATFEDADARVIVSDLTLVVTMSRVGATLEIRTGTLTGTGIDGESTVELKAHFARASEGPARALRLDSLNFRADRVPVKSLRLIGLLPRLAAGTAPLTMTSEGRLRSAEAERASAQVAAQLLAGGAAFFERGADVEIRYGRPAGAAPVADPGAASVPGQGPYDLELHLAGRMGEVHLRARHEGDRLVSESLVGEDAALRGGFMLAPGVLARGFGAVAPLGVDVNDLRVDARWRFSSRAFSAPVPTAWLEFRAAPGGAERRRAAGRRAVDLGGWLSRLDGEFQFATPDAPAHVEFLPGDGAVHSEAQRVDWEHRLTTVSLHGELGGEIRSSWRTVRAPAGVARVEVVLPGEPLTFDEEPLATFDVQLPQVPPRLLASIAPLPAGLAALMPDRFHRIDIAGQPFEFKNGRVVTPRGESPTRIDVWTAPDHAFEGLFDGTSFTCANSTVRLSLTHEVCETVFRRVMPWLEEVEPTPDGGRLSLTMKNFEVDVAAQEFRESGEYKITSDPIRVKLKPDLAAELSIESPDEWIDWTPAPIVLVLEPNVIRYRSIELPLGDDAFANMTGRYDRFDKVLDLDGFVDASLFPGVALAQPVVKVFVHRDATGTSVNFDKEALGNALKGLIDK